MLPARTSAPLSRTFSSATSKRLGIPEGQQLPRPIIEFYYKDDALHDPLVSEEHIVAFNWATQQDIDDCNKDGNVNVNVPNMHIAGGFDHEDKASRSADAAGEAETAAKDDAAAKQ